MSNWMNCPKSSKIISFAGSDILTGLDLYGNDIGLSDEQKQQIENLQKKYQQSHYPLSVDIQTKINEMLNILRKATLTDTDYNLLMSYVDEHTSIINKMEKLWVDIVFEAFQLLKQSQVASVRSIVDKRMDPFNGASFIGSI